MKQFRNTKYYVTEDGRVFSRYPVGGDNRFKKGKPSSNDFREVATGEGTGYKVVGHRTEGRWCVHTMVIECYGPPKPGDDYVVDHIDEDKRNNHINNLRWLTRGENVSRSHNQRHHSDELEDQIRSEFKPRVVTKKMLSEKYNIPLGTIKDILRRNNP